MRRLSPLLARHSFAFGLAAYAGAVVIAVCSIAVGVEAFVRSIFDVPLRVAATSGAPTVSEPATIRTAGLVPTQDYWADLLRDPAFWSNRRVGGGKSNSGTNSGPPLKIPFFSAEKAVYAPPQRSQRYQRNNLDSEDDDTTYRTVCVRLCDGAFVPVSFATTREHFEQDAAKCERSCGSDSRLYVYKNPGSNIEDMHDVDGRPYKALKTAFLYKTTYNEQCKCRPHPWEEAALDRHKVYALELSRAKGNKLAEAPLKELRTKIQQAQFDEQVEKKRLALAKVEDQKRQVAEAKAAKGKSRTATQIAANSTKTAAVMPPAPAVSVPPAASPPVAAPPTKPMVIASKLPPPASAEPTAQYQPNQTPRSQSTAPRPQAPKSDIVILRLGASATTRVQTPRASGPPAGSDSR